MSTAPNLDRLESFDALDPCLYRHKKCKQWGLAIIAWERGDKRGYQFEDGRVRIFKKGFYKLFEEVEPPEDAASDLVDELKNRLERSKRRAIRHEKKRGTSRPKAVYPFADQLRIFTTLYPQRFQDAAWTKGIRGIDAGRRLKRHRQPVMDEACELLAAERMQMLIDQHRHPEIVRSCIELLESTSLVTRSQLEVLRRLNNNAQRDFATTLYDLLYDDSILARRFDRFVQVLRTVDSRGPSWQLATVFGALVKPDEHVCVHPSTFRKQAASLKPELDLPKEVSALAYRGVLDLVNATRKALNDKGIEPADLMDVKDFVWQTLRPSAKKILDDIED